MNFYKEYLKKAIANNEVKDFIKGTNGYMLNPFLSEAEMPEEGKDNLYNYVLNRGFKCLYNETKDSAVSEHLMNALLEMAVSNDLFDIYSAVNALYQIFGLELHKSMNLDSNKINDLRNKLSESIKLNKERFELLESKMENINLYEYFQILNNISTREYNTKLL